MKKIYVHEKVIYINVGWQKMLAKLSFVCCNLFVSYQGCYKNKVPFLLHKSMSQIHIFHFFFIAEYFKEMLKLCYIALS